MSPNAFRRALRALTKRIPFRRFRVELFTGEQIIVRHPEAVQIREDVVLYIGTDRQHRFFDSFSVCQLLEFERERPIDLGQDKV